MKRRAGHCVANGTAYGVRQPQREKRSMVRRLSTNQLILIVLAVVIIGMGYWASRYLTWVEEEIDMGYSQEAKKDEFLAIGYFLREHGVASQTLRNFGLLDNMEWQGE